MNPKLMYHWRDKNKLTVDHIYLTNLYEKYLIYLSDVLNIFHKEKKDTKYWRIIAGTWLRYFIDIVFDRYEILRLNNQKIIRNIKFENKHTNIVLRSHDFESFLKDSYTDKWNENLFNLIKGSNQFLQQRENKFSTRKEEKFSFKNFIKYFFIKTINPLNRFINRDILVIDLGINLKGLLKFSIGSKILPYFTNTRKLNLNHQNKWDIFYKDIYAYNFLSEFEEILHQLILIYIPSIYTDNFESFKSKVLKDLKHLPKIIFTSYGYEKNEEFKIIAAETYLNGGKILIAQHGGNIGLAKMHQDETHQLKISTNFYSYGWDIKDVDPGHIIKMPSMQLSSFGYPTPKKTGKIVNILNTYPRYFYNLSGQPFGPEFIDYINYQKELSDKLKKEISSKLYHRLNDDDYGWNTSKILKDLGLKVCKSNISLSNELKKSSLCISSYNSTAALETLSANYPTILYWPKNLFLIRNEAAKYLNELEEAGIYHTDAKSASNHLNKIINDVEGWWNKSSVQKARKLFVSKYALSSKHWVKNWRNELIKQSKVR